MSTQAAIWAILAILLILVIVTLLSSSAGEGQKSPGRSEGTANRCSAAPAELTLAAGLPSEKGRRTHSPAAATGETCQSNSDCPSAQGGTCVGGRCMCGDIPACDISSSTPYCNESDSSCFQCHTDQVCNDPPNYYCVGDVCQECDQQTDQAGAKSKQCLPYGNACSCSYDGSECACYCRRDNDWHPPCDVTSDSPTCANDDDSNFHGCSPCKKDSDCPSWRPHCDSGRCNVDPPAAEQSRSLQYASGPYGTPLYDSPHYYPYYEAQEHIGGNDPSGRCRTTCRGGGYRGAACITWCRH